MSDTSRLKLRLHWDGARVRAASVSSRRPMAARLLQGKTAVQVAQLVPLLFSVCGRAQGAAASAALQAARGEVLETAALEQRIRCEAMQEHLWRMLLDWPDLLGLPRQDQQFAAWFALLRKIGAGETEPSTFLHEFEHKVLGMSAAEWCKLETYKEVQRWWEKSESVPARVLAWLDKLPQSRSTASAPRLLPAWSATEAQQACAGRWDARFTAQPDWQGAAAETGAWSYRADSALLRNVWQERQNKILLRVLARLLDLVELAGGTVAPRLSASTPAANEGIAAVRTARGLLLHHVLLKGDQVADYHIVAPTEWNFHPAGACARELCDLAGQDAELLKLRAQLAVMSLDPCVAYVIETGNTENA